MLDQRGAGLVVERDRASGGVGRAMTTHAGSPAVCSRMSASEAFRRTAADRVVSRFCEPAGRAIASGDDGVLRQLLIGAMAPVPSTLWQRLAVSTQP